MPKKNTKKHNLIAEGSFGCIFHPGMSCNHKPLSSKYITKIHSSNEKTTTNEITISKKIQTIPNYTLYFSPVLENCNVNLAKVDTEDIDKCTFINEDIKTNKPLTYISTQTRYVEGDTLLKYIEKQNPNNITTIIYVLYNKLCKCIQLLLGKEIVHFDLRENNMIITKQGDPIIIDYGISIDFEILKKKKSLPRYLKKVFYAYTTKYKPWCIEIVLISYLVNYPANPLTNAKIMEIFDEVMETNNFKNIPYLKDALPKYKEQFKTHVASKPANELLIHLLTTYKRWDTYSLAIILIQMLEKTGQTPNQTYIDKIKENLGFLQVS